MQAVSKVVISAHGDTNWQTHNLSRRMGLRDGETEAEIEYYGHMDNFGGVFATLQAYFSGEMSQDRVRIEVTYGEETNMEVARNVARTLTSTDVVIVVDVTGTPTTSHIVIEKCWNNGLKKFVKQVLDDIRHEICRECPDVIIDIDETKSEYTFFLGLPVPVCGGDYNAGPVYCFKADMDNLCSCEGN
jgi:hypothetical protein